MKPGLRCKRQNGIRGPGFSTGEVYRRLSARYTAPRPAHAPFSIVGAWAFLAGAHASLAQRLQPLWCVTGKPASRLAVGRAAPVQRAAARQLRVGRPGAAAPVTNTPTIYRPPDFPPPPPCRRHEVAPASPAGSGPAAAAGRPGRRPGGGDGGPGHQHRPGVAHAGPGGGSGGERRHQQRRRPPCRGEFHHHPRPQRAGACGCACSASCAPHSMPAASAAGFCRAPWLPPASCARNATVAPPPPPPCQAALGVHGGCLQRAGRRHCLFNLRLEQLGPGTGLRHVSAGRLGGPLAQRHTTPPARRRGAVRDVPRCPRWRAGP